MVTPPIQTLEILDDGRLERLDYDGLLHFHQGGAIWGATVAFRAMQRMGDYFSKVAVWDRRSLTVTSGHPGPGVRDAVEYVTRCVSRGRYRLTQPELDGQCHKDLQFTWWVDDGARTVRVAVREGFIPKGFFVLVDRLSTPRERPGDQLRLRHMKADLTRRLWAESFDHLFDVTEAAHHPQQTGLACTS